MGMTDEPDVNDVEVDDQPSLSWQENELVSALRRLANARSQLATLEAEADRASQVPPVGAAAADGAGEEPRPAAVGVGKGGEGPLRWQRPQAGP